MSKKNGRNRLAVGIHSCIEALRKNAESIEAIWIRKQRSHRLDEVTDIARQKKIEFREVDDKTIDKMAANNQGVAVELRGYPKIDWDELLQRDEILLVGLDGIEDPHNLGAIIRTSWLMGADGLVLTEHRSAGLSPAVHKVACGGVEHVPLERVSKFSDLSQRLKKNGFWIYGLSAESKTSILDFKPAAKTLIIAGAEDKGIRSTTAKQCDELIGIPQLSQGPSYNASVAMAMALIETQRQRSVF